jgi:RimJ/RimL family protein N-acetyltransferase
VAGLLDDKYDLSPVKQTGALLLGGLVAALLGVRIEGITNPLAPPSPGGTYTSDNYLPLGIWSVPLTMAWVFLVAKTFDFLDGLDGLAAGVCAIASGTIGLLAAGQGDTSVALMSGALAGACLGFLRYNYPRDGKPASIFMGTIGGQFLGFVLAALSIVGGFKIPATDFRGDSAPGAGRAGLRRPVRAGQARVAAPGAPQGRQHHAHPPPPPAQRFERQANGVGRVRADRLVLRRRSAACLGHVALTMPLTASGGPLADDLILAGDRVLLRPLCVEDAEAMYAYACDPFVTRFLPWEPAPDVDSVRPFLRDQVRKRQRSQALGLAIILKATGQMIGSTDLMDLSFPTVLRWHGPKRAELGYLLARPFWGQGIMTEAAGLTLGHAFGALGLTQIFAWADGENQGSLRVLEKLGMCTRGTEIRDIKGERRLYIRYEIGQVLT